jgi:hypothetical protein
MFEALIQIRKPLLEWSVRRQRPDKPRVGFSWAI